MTFRPFAVALFLGLSLAPRPGHAQTRPTDSIPPNGVIHGTVLGDRGTEQKPLPNAIISFLSGSQYFTVVADSRGNYQLEDLHPGPWRVKALHVGFTPVAASVHVPEGGTVHLDLSLSWDPILLPTLLVRAEPLRPLEPGGGPPPSELGELSIRALEGTPGMV